MERPPEFGDAVGKVETTAETLAPGGNSELPKPSTELAQRRADIEAEVAIARATTALSALRELEPTADERRTRRSAEQAGLKLERDKRNAQLQLELWTLERDGARIELERDVERAAKATLLKLKGAHAAANACVELAKLEAEQRSMNDNAKPRAGLLLAAGLSAFGVALGLMLGMSVTTGTVSTVITGGFTFVGGALLTYSGFKRLGSDLQTDLNRTGLVIFGFSFGLIVGILTGAAVRTGRLLGTDDSSKVTGSAPVAAESSAPPSSPPPEATSATPSVPSTPLSVGAAVADDLRHPSSPAKPIATARAALEKPRHDEQRMMELHAATAACDNVTAHLSSDGKTYLDGDRAKAAADITVLVKDVCSLPEKGTKLECAEARRGGPQDEAALVNTALRVYGAVCN